MNYSDIPEVEDRTILFLLRHWDGHKYLELETKLTDIYGDSGIYDRLIESEMDIRGYIVYENIPDRYTEGYATIRTSERGAAVIRRYKKSRIRQMCVNMCEPFNVLFSLISKLF